jgi:GT2 family glycosyltransferase
MQTPEIGVIVPSYNDQRFLQKLTDSLWSSIAGATFSIVIVDDHSTDGTPEWVQTAMNGYGAYIQPERKSYFTRCVNYGIDYALQVFNPNYFLLLNSDITVTPYWAAGMIGTARGHNAGVVGATLHYPDGHIQHLGGYGPGQHMDINKIQTRGYDAFSIPWVTGAAMMISREVIQTVGLLPVLRDVVQYDASDREFCKRVITAGFDVFVSPALMYHDTLTAEHIRRSSGQYQNPAMQRVDR